tara:strand:+ start:209 stop:1132 length:924 start_codon:yes stop_codon:yes gene_type:complete
MKIKITIITVLFFNILVCQVPNYVSSNGLQGWWAFNGNANDNSDNNNNGTINGAVLGADRFQNPNSAFYFNGTNSYILFSPLFNVSSAVSVSIWLKSENNTGQWNGLITTQNNNQQGFLLQENQNNHYDWTVSNGSGYYDLFSNTTISNGWKHLVCIVEQNSLKIYVNGVLDNSIQINPYNLNSTANLNIGSRYLNEYYKGFLDDIGIWNRALTQVEITALYTGVLSTESFTNISSFQLYPNPAYNILQFKCTEMVEKISIYNALGQLVQENKINSMDDTISIEHLAQGSYFVKINNQNASYTLLKK